MADAVLDLIIKLKDEASAGLGDIAGKIGEMGKVAAGIGVAGITAVGVAAGAAVKETLAWTEQMDGLGDVLGTSAKDSAALAVAIQGVGGDTDKVTSQLSFMQKTLYGAKGALGPAGEALKSLGINVKDAGFKSAGAADQMAMIASKIDQMPDGLEKSTLMMKIFGKSGKDMSDTMHALANGGLDEARKKAEEYGLVLDEDAAAANIKFGQGMNDLNLMMKGLVVTAGSQLLPIIIPLAQQFVAFAREHMPAVKEAIVGVISGFTNFAQQVIPIVAGAFAWISSTVQDLVDRFSEGDISGAVNVLAFDIATAFGMTQEEAGALADKVSGAFDMIVQTAGEVVAWVQANWPPLQEILVSVFNSIVTWVQANWPPFRDLVIQTFTEIVAWVTANWPAIQAVILQVVEGIKTGVSTALDAISQWWTENGAQVQEIATTAWELIKTIVSAAIEFVKTIVGSNLDETSGKVTSVMDVIKGIFATVWDAIKLALGIALDLIEGVLKAALDLMKGDTDGALGAIRDMFDSIWTKIKTTLGPVIESIKKVVNDMLEAIKTKADTELAKVKQFFTDRFNDAVQAIRDKVDAARNAAGAVIAAIQGKLESAAAALKAAIVDPIQRGIDTVAGLIKGIEDRFNTIKSAVANFRLPVFNTPSAPAAGGNAPGRTGGNSISSVSFGLTPAPITINVYGASRSDVELAVARALRAAGYRADARLLVG